ncbi:MAG: hypothetical protein HC850_15115 [Rhodomicrobium sp.]|nr:hypothetical protein [Rhodomicrobium sp.]
MPGIVKEQPHEKLTDAENIQGEADEREDGDKQGNDFGAQEPSAEEQRAAFCFHCRRTEKG